MEELTVEDLIRIEAYCIFRTRQEYGIPGDKEGKGDWLEAERKIRRKLIEDVMHDGVKDRLENGY